MLYHIVWCTKYRHPILTGAVEVKTKTILAQTCMEYGCPLKALEMMPEHVHLFFEAFPDEAPSSIARMSYSSLTRMMGVSTLFWKRERTLISAGTVVRHLRSTK